MDYRAQINQTVLRKVGIKVGHYTDAENLTGLTCFIAESGSYIGIDIRGSNTGTLETAAYGPKSAIDLTNAVLLTGGSLFGLEAAFGIMQYLEENSIGYDSGAGTIPGVAGAVIYDLKVGNNRVRPKKEHGYYAAQHATDLEFAQGNVGVGTGATVGKWAAGIPMKGGFGIGVTTLSDDIMTVAFVVTNAIGDIINPQTGEFYSESGKQSLINNNLNLDTRHLDGLLSVSRRNTTLAVIATNIKLQKTQLMKVAEHAHDGMARAIHPVHTSLDGDIVFALSSLSGEQKVISHIKPTSLVDLVGLAAADALTKAINSSVVHAKSIEGFPAKIFNS